MTALSDEQGSFLREAINLAKESVAQGGFPAGAVVVKDGKIIGRGISIGNQLNDPTSHGEMASIRAACSNIKSSDLSGAMLYSSMQPCLMCFAASMWGGISKIFYAASKESVSVDYYGGHYDVSKISPDLLIPIEMTHIAEFQAESLAIIRGWEKSLG